MSRYIWITSLLLVFIIALALKQAPKEPPVESIPGDIAQQLEEGEPVVSESGNILVTRPQPGAKISSPVLIRGEARVFENTFNMRLVDTDGNVIAEKFATADAPDVGEFGSFGELLVFDEVDTDEGFVEVYSESAEDGSEINLVRIPVNF